MQVPRGETIGVPAGVIHSKNYIQGNWIKKVAIESNDEVEMLKDGERFCLAFSEFSKKLQD